MSTITVTRQERVYGTERRERQDVVIAVGDKTLPMNWREFRALAEAVAEFDEKTKHGAGMNIQVKRYA